MTRLEALHIFQLPNEATAAQIESVYQDRFNALQQQLRNAPTESLGRTYQNNLADLSEAYQTLKTANVASLPSTKPIAVSETATTAAAQTGETMHGETGAISPRLTQQLEKLKKQKTYFLVALIGLASVLSYFIVQYFDLKGLRPKAEKYDLVEKKLLNKKFSIKNFGKQAYTIVYYHIWYFDAEGNLKEKEDGTKNTTFQFRLEPDKTFTVTEVVGKDVVFEGKAVAYSIALQPDDPTKAPQIFAGIFNDNADTPLNPDPFFQ